MADPRDQGCKCDGCGSRYKIDIYVSDDMWKQIKPLTTISPYDGHTGGLLCPVCIIERIGKLEEFSAWRLTKV